MKVIALTIALVASAAGLAACGQSSDTKGTDQKNMSKGSDMKAMDHKSMEGKSGATHTATGTVKSVDPKSETVTLDHGPVPSMNWPAMTMTFKVKDKTLMDKLQAEKKVEVEFVQEGKNNVIVAVK